MSSGKKYSYLQWEKVLKVMVTGEPISRESLEKMDIMKDVPLYRISSFLYCIKNVGGVVKVIKNGRKVVSYQLMNTKEMEKYLTSREKTFRITKLNDLQAKQVSADVATAEVVVDEVTEVTQ
jgi:hypothetical protein